MWDLRASGDQSGDMSGRVDSGSILVNSRVNPRSILDPILGNLIKRLHLAVGRAWRLEYD